MNRNLLHFAMLAVMTIAFGGCASLSPMEEAQKQFEEFQETRPPAAAVETGDAKIDNISHASAELYGFTIRYLDEYIAAADNRKEYLGFIAEVEYLMKNKNISREAAYEEVRKACMAEAPEIWPKVVEGYNAVNALEPENKLNELLPLVPRAAQIVADASSLQSSLLGFDAAIINKLSAVKSVLVQAKFSGKALDFLVRQYQLNQEAKAFMADAQAE